MTFRYGLVYAVRFFESDVPNLTYSSSDGLITQRSISSERIIAKAKISPLVNYHVGDFPQEGQNRVKVIRGDGIVGAVVRRRIR